EDATQETFVRVFRHLDQVPNERGALYWIYRVATNVCLSHLRQHRRQPSWAPMNEAMSTAGGDIEAQLADRDTTRRLVALLPPKLGVVAWLHHVDGLGQDEVAAIVGVSRRTVASRLAGFGKRARKLLERSGS